MKSASASLFAVSTQEEIMHLNQPPSVLAEQCEVLVFGDSPRPPIAGRAARPWSLLLLGLVVLQRTALADWPPSQAVSWGERTTPYVKPGTTFQKIAAGDYHTLALTTDGSLLGWGHNWAGQCVAPPGLSNVIAIAGGGANSLALSSDGTVVAWGENSYGQANVPAGLSNVVAIAAGGGHGLALKSDGTVVAWGQNFYGQTNVPAGLTDVVAVAAGGSHSLALRSNGRVVAWGNNSSGQTNVPAGLTNAVAIAAGQSHSLALKSDGTIVAWGENGSGQSTVPSGSTKAVAIAGGRFHSLAIVGPDEVLLRTPGVSEGGVKMSLWNGDGRGVAVQVSSNLQSWTILTNFSGLPGAIEFLDATSPRPARRFYRAVAGP